MTTVYALLGAALGLLTAVPASAQSGVGTYTGTWIGSAFSVEAGSWPDLATQGFAITIDGDDRDFEADWSGLVADDGSIVWDDLSQEFESAERPGYFRPDDDADIFDGEAQYWAFSGEAGLVLGRLQFDDVTGNHLLFVCHLIPSEAGMDAVLVLSGTATATARARLTLVRR